MAKFICNMDEPVVATKKGKLRGFLFNDIYTFYGIPYAKAKRFHMPEETDEWEGIRDALTYGKVCPLMWKDTEQGDIMSPHRFWIQDENCQNLNVWTPSLDTKAKKPVMVWLHGGGFFSGSAIEQLAYDGHNLSKTGDIVTVTVNHRLNTLGYLDLRGFGDQYSRSVNAGNGDLIAALKWVHDNISAFGGDPENVTIFGQSGGGGKVITLLQMPEAEGLIHKGIIMSGILGEIMTDPELDMRPTIRRMLEILKIKEEDITKLETIPYEQLADGYLQAYKETMGGGGIPYFGPVKNEDYVGDPMKVGFTKAAKKIPILIGSVISEFSFLPAQYDKSKMTDKEMEEAIRSRFGNADGQKLIDLFRKAYPERKVIDVLTIDSQAFRYWSKKWIEKRISENTAPTYSYLFTLDFDFKGGVPAWHCSDIPFFFHNIDKVPIANIDGISDRLQDQMCGAFVSFARTGNPGHKQLPDWPNCTASDEATMLFDRQCQVKHNFDTELISLHKKLNVCSMPKVEG